jgi:hypothetical protein
MRLVTNALTKVNDTVKAVVTRRLEKLGIPGVARAVITHDIQRLRDRGIHHQDALLKAFEKGTIDSLATDTHISIGTVAALLDSSLSLAGARQGSRIKRHWFDLAVIALIAGLWLLYDPSLRRHVYSAPPPPARPRVVALKDIAAFAPVRAEDLKVENEGNREKQQRLLLALTGNYAVAAIKKGSAVTASQVSSRQIDLTGQSILKVPLRSSPPLDNRPLPLGMDLLLSPRDHPGPGAQIPVTVLTLDSASSTPTATVAIMKANATEMAKLLGSSDAYLQLQVP